jgi:hypothetical protein
LAELAIEYRPISALIPYARNARTHSEEQIAQIAASIRASCTPLTRFIPTGRASSRCRTSAGPKA